MLSAHHSHGFSIVTEAGSVARAAERLNWRCKRSASRSRAVEAAASPAAARAHE